MLYHLFEYLKEILDIPGGALFSFISFRAVAGIILSLLIAIIFGKAIIRALQRAQIGEEVRNLGLEGQLSKKGTPTMGGVIIIAAIILPVLLFADLTNVYIQLMLISTVWLGVIGFADDYIKVFKGKKAGLSGKLKVLGQIGLGVIIGSAMWMHSGIVIRENVAPSTDAVRVEAQDLGHQSRSIYMSEAAKSTTTTVPFFKESRLDYRSLVPIEGKVGDTIGWLLYVFVAIFIITAVSNGANLTDGLDGLASGVSVPIVLVLGIMAYLSGNIIFASYLDIPHIPGSGELMIFAAAFAGALIGFMWYNTYPAQVFMGDTGSLTIGGIIAVFALLIRKELILPVLCGIFLIESLSVIMQVGYFKYTKRKYGEGRRIFLMSPLHHHYQKKGYPETKIVLRFWIVQLLLAAIALMTLKLR